MPATPILRTFMQYLSAFCSRLEEASDAISGRFVGLTLPDECEKFRNPELNRSGEIPPEAVRNGIFDSLFLTENH